MNLYELTQEYVEFAALLDDPDWDEDSVLEKLAEIDDDIDTKADSYARVIRNLEAEQEICKREAKRFSERAKAKENQINRLKRSLESAMLACNKPKIKTDLFSLYISNNPPSLVLDAGLDDIPVAYLVEQEPKIDKARIKEDLKAGADLTGIAHLEVTESLRIR